MTYIELLDEFWKQDRVNPMSPLDAKFYFYLLDECNKRQWINPFELQSRITEISLMITRKTIGEVRNRLKQRGLIDFISATNKPTIYRINNVAESNDCLFNCFSQVAIKKPLRVQFGNIQGYNSETIKETPSKEKSPIPPKEYTPKESDNNINNSSLRTREEIELEKFDSFLQDVLDGNHQVWEDQMRKKHGIDNVVDYLPSFRNHVIANAKMGSVSDINGFKKYFNVCFRFFAKINPIEQLQHYLDNSENENFRKFCKWVLAKAPNVARGIIPLTEEELDNLISTYGTKEVFTAILDLNNREDLINKYFSLYRTLINWLKK